MAERSTLKCKLWAWAWLIGCVLSTPLLAQSFNLGLGVVNSRALGFEEWYGTGVIEASGATNSIQYRLGLEITNAEKLNQNGWGGNMDLTITKPFTETVGAIAFYRPSWIHQSDYDKSAHVVGAGISFTTKHNGRWDIYAGFANDQYKQQHFGIELRVGQGYWLRIKTESVEVKIPSTGKKQRGSRVSLVVAPRIRW